MSFKFNSDIFGMKSVLISFKHEYRRLILSSHYDVISQDINIKTYSMDNLHMVFPYLTSYRRYIEYVE